MISSSMSVSCCLESKNNGTTMTNNDARTEISNGFKKANGKSQNKIVLLKAKKKKLKKKVCKKSEGEDCKNRSTSTDKSDAVAASNHQLLNQVGKTSQHLNGHRLPLTTQTKDSEFHDEQAEILESQGPELEVNAQMAPEDSSNENKENINESVSIPSITVSRIETPAKAETSPTTMSIQPASSSEVVDPMPSCSKFQDSNTESCQINSSSGMSSSSNHVFSASCVQAQAMTSQQQTDYMGLALKQWSMYLGNVLLNFIQKERKNNSACENSVVSNTVEQLQQQQLSNLAVAVGSRASNSFLQAAVAAAASNNLAENKSGLNGPSSSESTSSDDKVSTSDCGSADSATNLIGDATTVISQGYCPCCHYHSHLQQQQQQHQQQQQDQFQPSVTMNAQQHQQVIMAALQHQSGSSQNFQQGYYNYAANFSPFLANQRNYLHGKDLGVDLMQDVGDESEDERCFEEMNNSIPSIQLPSCDLDHLEELSELFSSCIPSPLRREKLAIAIENGGYLKKIVDLFRICETQHNTRGLQLLSEIMKNMFYLNRNSLYELMFCEDLIFDVVGCLEFDPTLPEPKRHREYLKSIANFNQVVKISNPLLLQKIHQTYRIQYIQDMVLPTPSVFEENLLSTLSSFIFFNKQEIVSIIQEDEKFLVDLFAQLTDQTLEESDRKNLMCFLREFFTYAQTLQTPQRDSIFKLVTNLGILKAIEINIQAKDAVTKGASIDTLLYIVEFSPSLVREYMLHQLGTVDNESILMNVIINQMLLDGDPEVGNAVQLVNIIKILLDPENMLLSSNKSEKTDFLNFFYRHCMHFLTSPLLEEISSDCQVHLQSLVLELISFFVEHHTYHIKNYILHKDLLRGVLDLMRSRHKYLALYALRLLRKIVGLRDEFYNRYIIKGNHFAPVVEALLANRGRYNLLDSAILEMFEFIKLEDIKSLYCYAAEKFGEHLSQINYVQTFKNWSRIGDRRIDQQNQISTKTNSTNAFLLHESGQAKSEFPDSWFNNAKQFELNTTTDYLGSLASSSYHSNESDMLSDCNVQVNEKMKNGIAMENLKSSIVNSSKGYFNTIRGASDSSSKRKGKVTSKVKNKIRQGLVDYNGNRDKNKKSIKRKEVEEDDDEEVESLKTQKKKFKNSKFQDQLKQTSGEHDEKTQKIEF